MKFSIITATKNAEKYIETTINSVGKQIDVEFEHIIIDSASTDKTVDIIKQYNLFYPIKYISEPDDGISDAFNKGINLSSGDWIIFMGAGGMFIHSTVLMDMDQILKNKSSSLVVWGNIRFIKANGRIGKRVTGKFTKFRFKRYMCIPHQATFHNKRLFEKYGLFSNNVKVAMDYDIFLRCLKEINIVDYVDYDVSYMLTGGNSQLDDNGAITDYRNLQIQHNVWPPLIANILFYWAKGKFIFKNLVNYNYQGFNKPSLNKSD